MKVGRKARSQDLVSLLIMLASRLWQSKLSARMRWAIDERCVARMLKIVGLALLALGAVLLILGIYACAR